MQISDIQNLTTTMSNEITKLQQEIEQLKKTATETQLVSQSTMIRFSQTRKHSELQVSGDQKELFTEVVMGTEVSWEKTHFFQGNTGVLVVGVVDESEFLVSSCYASAHCIYSHGGGSGCLSGNKTKWNPGELVEINVNLINHTLTIKSVRNSSINLVGTLPRLSSGNYYLYAHLFHSDQLLEIVE
ncbi:hypothetical protein GEMRC1_012299 [Eukaryota sp. GEM-RC1]